MITATRRAYLYPLLLAVIALAGTYGLIDNNEVALWSALVAAVLGVGTAGVFTRPPVKDDADAEPASPLVASPVPRDGTDSWGR